MTIRGTMARLATLISIGAAAASLSLATPAMAASHHQASRAAASSAAVPASANTACTVVVRGSGVRVRTGPHLNSTVVGEIQAGQQFTDPDCLAIPGDSYTACGLSEDFWVHFEFNGVLRYAAAACFEGF